MWDDRRNSRARVEIKGLSSNFSVLQLAGETAQHDLDLRHPKFASKRKIRSCWQLQLLKVHKYTASMYMVLATIEGIVTIRYHRIRVRGRGGEGEGTGAPHI